MGLFDKFSKKEKNSVDELAEKASKLVETEKKEETKKEEKKPEESSVKADTAVKSDEKPETEENKSADTQEKPQTKNLPAEERRFTIVVEDAYQIKDGKGIAIGGNVHGTVKKHDKIYIVHPIIGESIETEIDDIEDGPMNTVDSASDTRVGIKITSVKNIEQVPKYSVVTNIKPQNRPTAEHSAESPFLFGLCREYNRLIKEPAFQHVFTFAVFSARYITPVQLEIDKERSKGNKAALKKDSAVSFKLLHHPNHNELLVLPVFTDFTEMRKWKSAHSGNEVPQNFFMTFEQCSQIGLRNNGLVINPFGENPVYVSNDNIKHSLAVKANLDKKIAEDKNQTQNNKNAGK